ncbi:hypothetical protein TCAL_09528 [Tigriopus californicus]|uniref:Ion transport domain-containing protein n=1 Tax=Tigriopus californicus TaxID=6832 RepID=A0A553N8H0_TIGCA|nr:transient receptor potential cation channel subfamily A member 1-like [Tigriopus californicus]TRY61746.1 hypothetical protein TCAL_09528 [Tigriopus californicus]|eukprot:TCALIF_09528-PA protein Name:"Similar to pain Transient receptor potential cation channel protein painless (Drosophila melanogaster)" AED:0.01 eAED:0.02 QI:97/1/0.5/1/1/1/2/0/1046
MAYKNNNFKGKGPKGALVDYCRTTSCFGDLKVNALACLNTQDENQFRNILAEECPMDDGNGEWAKGLFPLPEDHWINQPYGEEQSFKTLLHLAIERSEFRFIEALLSAGARADQHNELLGLSPIHVAIGTGNLGLVKTLVGYMDKKPRINRAKLMAYNRAGQTALHLAASGGRNDILTYLVEHPDVTNVDPRDLTGGQTPLYLAAKNGHAKSAELLIAHGAQLSLKICGKTVEDVIKEKMPYFDPLRVDVIRKPCIPMDIGDHLNTILDQAQMNLMKKLSNSCSVLEFMIFIQQLNPEELNQVNACGMTLFQKACDYGLHEHVQAMLDHGMNPKEVCPECSTAPVLLAAANGCHEVIQVLKGHKVEGKSDVTTNFSVLETTSGESVLTWVLKKPKQLIGTTFSYEKCFNILMEDGGPNFNAEITRIINHKDSLQNTPLHYGAQLWNQNVVRQLLERGANVGIRNIWEETPIALIMPETMESFLDDYCLRSKNEVTHDDFSIEFNYSFLAPPVDDPRFDENDLEGQKMVENAALPETESLWYMSQSKHHRHLLNHPVVTSFLWLKWQRIRGYFNRNLRFYLMFVACLSWYIFERFGGISSRSSITEENDSFCAELSLRRDDGHGLWYALFAFHACIQVALILGDWRYDCIHCDLRTSIQMCFTGWLEALTAALICGLLYFKTHLLWTSLTILMALLILREVLQMSASLKRYLVSPENWLEMVMIGLVAFILWVPDALLANPCEIKRHLSAIAIILSWAELITLVGRHPRLGRYNIYVTMFYKVLKTFFRFLIWYSFFILAFGLGFYIMLHKDIPGHDLSKDEYQFFNYPWLALVKTSTMFVGEIEFSDIPIDLEGNMTHIGYLFLLAFIFLIVVVLMNLLNGLAVSDTGIIREKAQIVSAISRVETISYIESLMLGDPFDFLSNWPPFSFVKAIPSLAICRCLYRNQAIRDVSHKITGATGILLFYSMLPTKTMMIYPNKRSNTCFSLMKDMSKEVISDAKTIIVRREESKRWDKERFSMETQIRELREKMDNVEEKLGKIIDILAR